MKLFAVIRTFGGAWNPSLPLEQQQEWAEHASFMTTLENEGFVLLGGPLEGASEALLIFRAGSAEEILDRLQQDPWSKSGTLRVTKIAPWTLRMGSI